MNVVIYARYSSTNQREQSIEGQLRDCYAYCKRMGYKVTREYIDRALSAYKDIDKRDEFQEMIRDARKRQFDMVVVYAFDRFARNRYDSVVYKKKLKDYGVKVYSVTESFGDADESMPYEAMLEWAAENYSRSLGKNAARGMRESALKGQITGGHRPFGYKIVDKKLEIDDAQAVGVRLVFELYDSGKAKGQIAAELNARGFRTFTGRLFTFNNITQILKNRLYIGDHTYKPGDPGAIPRSCPRIVDDDIFNRCQARAEREKKVYGHKRSDVEYMLSGKLFCGHCGGAMTGDAGTGKNGARFYYYTCHNRKRWKKCKKKSEKLAEIEQEVVRQTVGFILCPSRIDVIAEKIAAFHKKDCGADKIDAETRRLENIEREINACVDALIKTSNQLALDRINERLALLELQKSDAEITLEKLKIAADMSITAAEVSAWLRTFCDGSLDDPDFCRRIIYAFINSVFVYDDKLAVYYNLGDLSGGKLVSWAENTEYISNSGGAGCSDSCLNRQPKTQHTKTVCCVFVCGAECEKTRGNRVFARVPSADGREIVSVGYIGGATL